MNKHRKYRILGVGFLLLVVFSLALLAPTYAVEPEMGTGTKENLTCKELYEQYGLSISRAENENQYVINRHKQSACGDASTTDNPIALQLVKINSVDITNGPILKKPDTHIEIDLAAYGTSLIKEDGTNNEYFIATLVNKDDDGNVIETIEVKFSQENMQEFTKSVLDNANNKILNENYNGVCKSFREEVSTMDADSQAYYKSAISYCWDEYIQKGTEYTEEELNTKIKRAKRSWEEFNSSQTTLTPEFESEFNRIKTNAFKKEATNVLDGSKVTEQTFSLKCKYNYLPDTDLAPYTNEYGEVIDANGNIVNSDGSLLGDGDESYSYLNKDYYYAKTYTESGDITYVYNYAPGNVKTETYNNVCKRTCEESLKVEYGPPVASKAGLCFEYQVKVTSYVKCDSSFSGEPPEKEETYCNPGVVCVTSSGSVQSQPQAGPSEEYELCVSKCDGGRYTQKCSVKCYNEVYADSDEKKIKLALNYEDAKAQKLASTSYTTGTPDDNTINNCATANGDAGYYGCYYYEGRTYNSDGTVKNKGTIRWASKNGKITQEDSASETCENNKNSAGRWYIDSQYHNWVKACDWNEYGYKAYTIDQGGFVRGQYGNASSHSTCDDTCRWKSEDCEGQYLNPAEIVTDYKQNLTTYEAVRSECAGAATCSSRTGTFTISINYKTNEKDVTVDFPYSSIDKDSISSKGDNNEGKDTSADKYSTILQRDGCYVKKENKNWYLTEWSFPGTYIHNKNGDISFEVPSDTSGWYLEDNKFCMPLNAKSVNTKWWEWAVRKNDCYTADQIQNELKYNINASTNNFGYFGWNINISCFYALRNEICDVTDPDECCPGVTECENPPCDKCENPPCDSTINYMVRSVDRQNLFPNAAAEGTVDENTREIGFNWTRDAATSKNSNYVIDPATLITDIETNANLLYSDDNKYLDYQFYLTPESLRKIRNYNKDHPYGEWSGETKLVNGINAYSSNVFRSTGSNSNIISGDAVIKTGEIGVNNQ